MHMDPNSAIAKGHPRLLINTTFAVWRSTAVKAPGSCNPSVVVVAGKDSKGLGEVCHVGFQADLESIRRNVGYQEDTDGIEDDKPRISNW